MLRSISLVSAFSAVLALAACSSSSRQAQPQSPEHQTMDRSSTSTASAHDHSGHREAMCPMKVKGVVITTEDTQDGIAVVFTTESGDLADLRQRVQHMADMHNQMHGGQGGMHGQGGGGGMRAGATARAETIEGGARIVLTPKDPKDLEMLRSHVRDHAARMARGECPMMENQGAQGAPEGSAGDHSEHEHEGTTP